MGGDHFGVRQSCCRFQGWELAPIVPARKGAAEQAPPMQSESVLSHSISNAAYSAERGVPIWIGGFACVTRS
jgi:hypothetical protein